MNGWTTSLVRDINSWAISTLYLDVCWVSRLLQQYLQQLQPDRNLRWQTKENRLNGEWYMLGREHTKDQSWRNHWLKRTQMELRRVRLREIWNLNLAQYFYFIDFFYNLANHQTPKRINATDIFKSPKQEKARTVNWKNPKGILIVVYFLGERSINKVGIDITRSIMKCR